MDVQLLIGNSTTEHLTISNSVVNSILDFNISVSYSDKSSGIKITGETQSIDPSVYSNHYTREYTVDRRFSNPVYGAEKASSGAKLFAVDMNNGDIVELDPSDGTIIDVIYTPIDFPWGPEGLAYDGTYLYFTDGSGIIFKIDPATHTLIEQRNFGLVIDALACSDESLFVLIYTAAICEADFNSGTIVDTIYSDFNVGGGLSFGGERGTLFCSNWNGDVLEIDINEKVVVNTISLYTIMYGLAYSNSLGLLFVADYGYYDVLAIDPDNSSLAYSFNAYVSGLAADEAGPMGSWLSVLTESGSIEGGTSTDLAVQINASDLELGEYWGYLNIENNDPLNPMLVIPVHLEVVDYNAIDDGVNAEVTSITNFPNPFNDVTTFRYYLQKNGNVSIEIYDLQGEIVGNPVNEYQEAGLKYIDYPTTLPSGIYLYKLIVDGATVDRNTMIKE
jgi:hypothetical protein